MNDEKCFRQFGSFWQEQNDRVIPVTIHIIFTFVHLDGGEQKNDKTGIDKKRNIEVLKEKKR
jgi:hypothetical protein